jgi:outer membrane protein TolC
MRIWHVVILASLLIPRPGAAQSSSLTIDEAVAAAVASHPQVLEAAAGVDGSLARADRATAPYYPEIGLIADWNKGRNYFTHLNGARDIQAITAGVTLRQNLYDFGRTAGSVEAGRRGHEAARELQSSVKRDMAFRAKEAFYQLLAAEKQLKVIEENARLRSETLRQARESFASGKRSKLDVVRAESSFYAVESLLSRAESNREVARMELAMAMGSTVPVSRPLAEPAVSEGSVGDLTGLQRQALIQRPELRRLQSLRDAADGTMKSVRSGHLPLLSASASAGIADNAFLPDGGVWNVGVTLAVPLFAGYATVNQERDVLSHIRSIDAQNAGARMAIIREVEGAWFALRDAESRFESSSRERSAARETMDLQSARYRDGSAGINEIADAQVQLLAAETASVHARCDIGIARARLARASGAE